MPGSAVNGFVHRRIGSCHNAFSLGKPSCPSQPLIAGSFFPADYSADYLVRWRGSPYPVPSLSLASRSK
jgi:hypothetical protein